MGLLDFLGGAFRGGGQAPFGFGQQQPRPTLGQRFSNNDDMLMALGAGLLGHRQNATQMPLGDVMMGAMQGRRMDREDNRTTARENQTRGWLKRTFNLSDEDADAAVGNPEAMS